MTTRTRLVALMIVPVLWVVATIVGAQAPAGPGVPRKFCTRRTTFRIPFKVDERERQTLREVQLFVKKGVTDSWVCQETLMPQETEFTYRAAGDGEYAFSIVRVDKEGKTTPVNVNAEPPHLIVIVDTQAPVLEVMPVLAGGGEPLLKCEMRDANPDAGSIKLEYQAADASWQALEKIPDQPGSFRVPNAGVFASRLRVSGTDLAGNSTSREINPTQETATPAIAKPTSLEPTAPIETTAQKVAVEPAAEAKAELPPRPAGQASLPVLAKNPLEMSPRKAQQVINGTHAILEYQIEQLGPSGVGKVEVWLTTDEGQTWQRLCDDPDCKSPAEFDLPGEGIFGLRMVVSNGRGIGGTPPAMGEAPDCLVEVDTTKPAIQLQPLQVGLGAEMGTALLTWTAFDKNLGTNPVDLFYATQPEGPWLPIAQKIKNDGKYRWTMPRELESAFFVRLEVTDLAGNVAHSKMAQESVVDQSRPRAKVLGVIAGSKKAMPPLGN